MLLGLLPLLNPAPVNVSGQAGQLVTLTVRLPQVNSGLLVNRDAPNLITLDSPWQRTQATPGGESFPAIQPELAGYFGKVNPTHLNMQIPASAAPGRYTGRLILQLFTCDKKNRICQQRHLTYPVNFNIGPTQTPGGTLDVKPSEFRRATRR